METPSLAFLEYLAELQQVEGKWVSPMDMLDDQDSKLHVTHEQQAANDEEVNSGKKRTEGDDKSVVNKQTNKEVEQ